MLKDKSQLVRLQKLSEEDLQQVNGGFVGAAALFGLPASLVTSGISGQSGIAPIATGPVTGLGGG